MIIHGSIVGQSLVTTVRLILERKHSATGSLLVEEHHLVKAGVAGKGKECLGSGL